MGIDIHGTVEYKQENQWKFGFSIERRFPRNYRLFGLFFGVANDVHFEAIAPFRGVPKDISVETWVELDPENLQFDNFAFSWINWKEIKSIDPEMETFQEDNDIYTYRKTEHGLEFVGKSLHVNNFSKEQYQLLESHKRLEVDDKVYMYRFVKVKEVFSLTHLIKIFRMMEVLASEYGDEDVRMVVGFDG